MEDLKRINKIGSGTYGTVYSGKITNHEDDDDEDECSSINSYDSDENVYAIKRNYKDKTSSWVGNLRELNFLAFLKGHPFIVDLVKISYGNPFSKTPFSPVNSTTHEYMEDDKIHFILEYVSSDGKKFFEDKSRCTAKIGKLITCQILLAVEFIHSQQITHRDLKPDNMLIDFKNGSPVIKICDFGMSQVLCDACPSTPNIATSWYRAWEVCESNPNYGQASDIWSVGCIVFEIFGSDPFLYKIKDNSNDVLNAIIAKHPVIPTRHLLKKCTRYSKEIKIKHSQKAIESMERKPFIEQMKIPDSVKHDLERTNSLDKLEDFLRCLMNIDFNERLTATEALEHEFLSEFSDYIEKIREKYSPNPTPLPYIKIKKCKERKWMVNLAFHIYNNSEDLNWYSNRVLFHSIDLFDRYLEYNVKNGLYVRPKESKNNGRFLDKQTSELYFYVCLYVMYKFYSSMEYTVDWEEFAAENFSSPDFEEKAEKFEMFLLDKVTDYKIYRDTLLEVSTQYTPTIDDSLICDLLLKYGNVIKFENKSVRALYRQLMDISDT